MGTVAGIPFTDEDILAYNHATKIWPKFFDAADMRLWGNDLDAFAIMEDDSILMSFNTPRRIDNIGWVDDI